MPDTTYLFPPGLYIPHSEKRFPGYDASAKELDVEVLRDYIYGGHIAEYMRTLKEDDEDMYKQVFSRYLAAGLSADDLEDMYKEAHLQIRANPVRAAKKYTATELANFKKASKKYRPDKLTYDQRKEKVAAQKKEFLASLGVETA